MTGDELLARLYNVDDDYLLEALDRLLDAAGVFWTCGECPWTNLEADLACEQCGKPREEVAR